MNKKGIELSLSTILGLVLAIAIIGLTAYFFLKVGGIIFPGKLDQGTKASFDRLIDEIEKISKKETDATLVPYSIQSPYVLLGFDKTGNIMTTCKTEKIISRPSTCLNKACLCICDQDKFTDKCFVCKTFENINSFSASSKFTIKDKLNFGAEKSEGSGQYYLVVYGQCPAKSQAGYLYGKFGVRNLQIVNNRGEIIFNLP